MTIREHRQFKSDANKSLDAIFGHVFRGESLNIEELEKHADVIQKLYYNYSESLEKLLQIRSNTRWFFSENDEG